ncbi:IS3 family transposase [Streptomyces albidoflavus]|uniref:IS3 family transposase n=1 Tax=Streptomyces albidoflavus TaxID=1886 RepID=UPI0038D0A68E
MQESERLARGRDRPPGPGGHDALAHEIIMLHIASRRTYGVPRIHAELRRLGHRVNRKRIARVMRERDIRGVTRRKHRSLTRPDAKAKPAPDLIGRNSTPQRRVSGPCSKKGSEPGPGPTGPPPALRSSPSSRPSTTAACASTRSSATSHRPRPGSDINTPSRHNERLSRITGKLQL